MKLVKQFPGCKLLHIKGYITLILLKCLHHLHWDTVVKTFILPPADIFLVNKFLCLLGISKQAKDSAIQKIRIVRKLDVIVITPVGKQGHDGTGTLGDTQLVRNKSKIWVCLLIKLLTK